MSNIDQIKVRRVYNNNRIFNVPVSSATVIAEGDLVKISSNKAVLVSSSGDTVHGFCIEGTNSGDHQPITVATEGVLDIKTASAFDIGETGGYSTGGASTDWTVTSAGSKTYVEAVEQISSGNRGRFYFKV